MWKGVFVFIYGGRVTPFKSQLNKINSILIELPNIDFKIKDEDKVIVLLVVLSTQTCLVH